MIRCQTSANGYKIRMTTSVTFLFARTFIYMLLVAGLVYLISLEGYRLGTDSEYSERSLTEWLESGCALFGGLIFLIVFRLRTDLRPAMAMLAALCLMMFIREADFYLDEHVFDGAWQTLVTLVLISVSVYVWNHRASTPDSIRKYASEPSSGIFLSGLLVLLVFSRLFGRSSFWQAVMGEGYVRVVKNIVEEGTEIMGYGLLSIAAIELLIMSLLQIRGRHE